MSKNHSGLAFIGFGEAGTAMANSLGEDGVAAYDIKLADPASGKASHIEDNGCIAAPDMATAIANAAKIICVVTADQAHEAAKAAAKHIEPGALYFDCNSCSPSTKVASASVINAAGGHYVDVAIMAPITARGHKTPMLVAGPGGDDIIKIMREMDMDVTLVGNEIGRASTIKMLRSVMIKGIEALTAECFAAACRAGVADEVAASLDASQSQSGWADQAAYNMERMTTHGIRRAAEMREVAKTLADLGISSAMSDGTISWQDDYGALGLDLEGISGLHSRVAAIEEAQDIKSST